MNLNAAFLDLESVDAGDLDRSSLNVCDIKWTFHASTGPDELFNHCKDQQIIVSNKVPLSEGLLTKLPELKLICSAATGFNHIDVDAAKRLGIPVCNVRNYATPAVVQHTFALLLNLVTSMDRYRGYVDSGQWSKSHMFCSLDFPIEELADKKLLIVGMGVLGTAVANVAKAFGMEILQCRRSGANEEDDPRPHLYDQLPLADVISLHCPLNEDTRHLINRQALSHCKRSALLINTSRGPVIDEDALLEALNSGQIAGAGLDVLSQEPPPHDHILLNTGLDQLIITPHTAWASKQSRQRLLNQIAEMIKSWQTGNAMHLVGP